MRSRAAGLTTLALAALVVPLLAQRPPTDEEKERARVRIGITREQQSQIEALFADTDRQMRDIHSRMRDIYHQLATLYEQYDFDREQARALRRQLMTLYRRRSMLHADNEEKLRKILNRDQFTKLRALIKEQQAQRMRDWNRRRGPGGGPPRP